MAKKRKYICSTCGAVSTNRGHLCSPILPNKAFECEYCGAIVGNPRHVCKARVAKTLYVCDACGRTSPKKIELCIPKKI